MISPVFAPGGSRPLFGRRALTCHSSGRRSLPRPFRPLARSLPPTIAPPVPLSVWPRSAAFCCYPAALPLWRVARVRAFPAWWQALAPRLRGRLHITFSESWRPLLCVLAGRTAPGGSVRVESFAGGVRTSPAGWGAPCFRCVGLCGRAHIGGGVAPQVRERRNACTAFAFLGAVRILCPPAPQNQ